MSRLTECLERRGGNYILPFFWQHGEDDETLIREIDAIDGSGVHALCVESRTHEQFCEDGWWHTMEVILGACRERNMKVWILDDKHFPSGYANGIIAKKYPNERMWGITERHMDVTGPQRDASVMNQWKTSPEDQLIGIIACRRVPGTEILTGETIDLTGAVYDDMVYFDVPEGCFRIVWLYKTRSGISDHYLQYADKLTELGGDAYIEAVYEPHYAHFKDAFGKTLAGFFSDEPCFGNNSRNRFRANLGVKYSHFPYTDEVGERLVQALGTKAVSMLPSLWFDTADTTMQRTRFAYMDIITKLYSERFTYKLGSWCRAHGVEYIGHIIEDDQQHTGTQNSAGHYFRALDGQDMAGIDVVLCQVVPGMTDNVNTVPCSYDSASPEFFHFTLPKLASSHAHIQKEKQGRAMCEIYGAYGWAEGLKMMKWLTDLMLVRGINQFVPHAFTPKFPDYDCPPHMYAQGKNPQYTKFRLLMDYMNRVCHITNGGVHCSSAALLYHAEARWVNGDAPGAHMRVDVPARYLTEHQIDYDIVSADYLRGAKVAGGRLCISDETYPCLIVPAAKALPQTLTDTLLRLAGEGLPVYLLEQAPAAAETGKPVPFAENGVRVISVDALDGELRRRGFADVTTDTPARFLRFYHYVHGTAHYYFMTNESIRDTVDCGIRLSAYTGGKYAVYDPMTNTARQASGDGASVHLLLRPYESVMLVFGEPCGMFPGAVNDRLVTSYPIEGSWDIFTAKQEEYPIFTPYRTTEKLFNMTGAKALPRFSGHMQYETTFETSKPFSDMRLVLDLGEVGETAVLLINGCRVGEKIAPPYRFDITDYVKNGTNSITVEVTNHFGYQMRDHFSKFLLFEPSGLLGPVTLEVRQILK